MACITRHKMKMLKLLLCVFMAAVVLLQSIAWETGGADSAPTLGFTGGKAFAAPTDGYKGTSFRTDLIGVHPRVILGTDVSLAELSRRGSDPDYADFYDKVVTTAANYNNNANWITLNANGEYIDGQDMEWRIPNLALAHYFNPNSSNENRKYFNKIKAYVNKVIGFENWGLARENYASLQTAATMIGISYAYDWCYDSFSAAEQANIRNKLLKEVRHLRANFTPSTYWTADYILNHRHIRVAGLMLTVMAIMGDFADDAINAELAEYYSFAESELENIIYWTAHDGSNHESTSYMTFGGSRVIPLVTAYEAISGVSLWEAHFRNSAYFKAYLYMPGLKNQVPFGDYLKNPLSNDPMVFLTITILRLRLSLGMASFNGCFWTPMPQSPNPLSITHGC